MAAERSLPWGSFTTRRPSSSSIRSSSSKKPWSMSRSYSARVKRRGWTGGMRMRWTNDTSAGCASQRPRCDARGVGRVKNLTDLRVEPSKVKHELTPTISDRKDRPCGPASPIRRQELQLQGARPGLLAEGRPVRALTPGRHAPKGGRRSEAIARAVMRHMTGGKDARESPRVPGRRRVVERCAADQVYACRRGGGLRLADPDADGVERRVHALPADRQAEAVGGAEQRPPPPRLEEARQQPEEVSGRNGGNGRRPPGHERDRKSTRLNS